MLKECRSVNLRKKTIIISMKYEKNDKLIEILEKSVFLSKKLKKMKKVLVIP